MRLLHLPVLLLLALPACDALGTAPDALRPRATSRDAAAPAAPADSRAVWDASTYIVRLSWSHDGLNTTSYSVERAVYGTGGPFVEVLRVPAPASGGEDVLPADARYDRSYLYRIRACNAAGCSPPNEISVGVPRLEPPTALAASPEGATTIALSWRDNSFNETAFLVTWNSSTGASGTYGVAANSTSHTFQAPAQGATYTFALTAVQHRQSGGPHAYSLSSNPASATLPPSTADPLVAPTNGRATYDRRENVVFIAWDHDAADGTTDYTVERLVVGGDGNWSVVGTARPPDGNAAHIRLDSEAQYDRTYLYRIRACNNGGCSAPHEISIGVPRLEPPGALTATPGASSVTLTWADNSDYETHFYITIRDPAGDYSQVRVPANTTTATVYAAPGGTYTYTVTAQVRNELNDSRAVSLPSNPVTVTIR